MDAMHAAIKAKRTGGKSHAPAVSHMTHEDQSPQDGSSMKALADSLSHEQKSELLTHLQSSHSKVDPNIEKGDPSDEEAQAIEQKIASAAPDEHEGVGEDESDDIAMSMLDSRHKGDVPLGQPRNLGERMKMKLASKLKAKGKI